MCDAVAADTVIAQEGAPVKIIGAPFQQNPFTVLTIATAGDISTPEDMVGKRIGVQATNTSLFLALLAAKGFDNDVEHALTVAT